MKFECFSEHVAKKVHDLHADTLKVYLSNTTPNVATMTVKADLSEIASGNGYVAGGIDIQNTVSRSGGVSSVLGVDATFTPSGSAFPAFRYAVLYNDTPTSPADPLIGYWDRGVSDTLPDGQPFIVDLGAAVFQIT